MQELLSPYFNSLGTAVSSTLAVCAAFTVVMFLWGIVTFLLSTGNETEKARGSARMIWGFNLLVLFFVVWEIIRWIMHTISPA